ncbi:cytochrome o ubiquinol oxidase subunit IV [Paenibacillus sp. CF384]|uniref:cytochrome o ubiquinol oxidase subunit IV n=1 Tax=Paenibacillus sp. CF384 TaxID=1884382 RepID=UPI000894F8C6|nr:cytochrome o ubiquinol oxidase subunit IV [Paenibacillus sp. CF384]SDX20825.1 cytochrome o ubiquinol oxidase operon protein cyoD [Paenibacillus sp. CF384]
MAQHGNELHGEHGGHTGGSHGSLKEYVTGFVLSIILTIIPLLIVMNHWMHGKALVAVLLGTAVLQFVLQLVFFMHLRDERGPRYNLMTLLLGLVVVITIVVGSIWIMTNNGM